MTVFLLVRVETDSEPFAIVNEVLSNLESAVDDYGIDGNIRVMNIPDFAEDIIMLHTSSQDSTAAIECAAALANWTNDLAALANVVLPEVDSDGETNLDKFNLTKEAYEGIYGSEK